MQKPLYLAVLLILILTIAAFAGPDQIKQVTRETNLPSFIGWVPDEFIVVMQPETGKVQAQKALNDVVHIGEPAFDVISDRFAVSKIRQQFRGADASSGSPTAELARYHKIKIEAGTLEEAMEAYRQHPMVEKVEPIGIHALYATPNDGYYDPYQWYHNQANDDDIDSPEAWDIQTGSSSIILAILDSGTRYYHPDLGGVNASPSTTEASRGNMWINDAELNGTYLSDDDGNGYVDDWIGYDFIENTSSCWPGEDCGVQDNDPRDFNGHGTHTAGIVGMITNDGYGMAGVAGGWGSGSQAEYGNGVRVMPLRIGFSYDHFLYGEVGVVYMDAAAEAFYYAADNGARIASCSWGSSNSGGIAAAADYFTANGGLIFVSAGNDGSETPAYLNSRSDCISVAATDENDAAATFTTYGTWVDISAPGVGIYSTYHDHTDPATNYWAAMDGTSMSCPMAAAVGAMIWSQNPTWTAAQVESQLYSSADNIDSELAPKYIGKMGAGRINLYNAVNTGPPPPPVAAFVGSPTSGTEPLTVDFTDQSTGTISTWEWSFGDGGSSTEQNPSYTYTSAGTYSVSLTVTGPGGSDTDTKTDYIAVDPCVAPTAGFVGSPTSGDFPLDVSFTDQSTGAATYSWNFGDGGSSTAANPNHTYTAAGTYTVTQTVTNTCGSDQLIRTDYITVTEPPPPPPTADFVGSPTSGDYPLTVNFTDLSTDDPTSWSWNFGDGVGTSTLQNPSYTYDAVGTYTVSLTATNAYGSDLETKLDYITVTEPGSATNAYAQSDTTVLGTVSGSYLNTYSSDDSYEIITEAESTNHPRKVTSQAEHRWTFNLGSGGSNMSFNLEAYRTSNADGDDFIFEYSTDGATYLGLVTVASASEQTYSAGLSGLAGTVYVRVRDTNRSWGNISLDAVYIDDMFITYETTPSAPTADFAGSPTSGEYPLAVSFTDLSTGSPTNWNWTFGDGGTSTAQNPSYTFLSAGTYSVSLSVSNAYGSDAVTKTDYITVTEPGINTSHVANMVVGRQKVGPNYKGACTVTIEDQNGLPLADATVFVSYDGPNSGTASGVTAADGTVSLSTGAIKKPVGEWCFEVTDVTHAANSYDADSNAVTRACESGWVYAYGTGQMLGEESLPAEFGISQNYPNPFNPTTTLQYALPEPSHVRLTVYNIAGQLVTILVDQYMTAGEHSVDWDGSTMASGIYLYRFQIGDYTETRKMILLK